MFFGGKGFYILLVEGTQWELVAHMVGGRNTCLALGADDPRQFTGETTMASITMSMVMALQSLSLLPSLLPQSHHVLLLSD